MDIPLTDIKGLKKIKDNFGGDYWLIDPNVLSKRKAWNYLLSIGFEKCPNKQYLRKGQVFAYNNRLKNYLVINFAI